MACDDTTPDPGLADTCISIAHGALPQWWLSPAITLNGASAAATAQQPPTVNVVNVTFHRTGGDSALPAGTSGVLVAVHACVPGLAMNPADASKVKQLGATGTVYVPLSQTAAGADTSLSGVGKTIDWPASTDPAKPDGPGHKCLVAVAYSDTEAPDPVCFRQAGGPGAADQHYAQLNIAIEPVPMHAERSWMFRTFTINPDRAAPAPARLRGEADIDPHPGVMEILLPALKATPGYRRVAKRPPQSIALQLPDFPDAVTRDRTGSSLPSRIMGFLRIKSSSNPSHEVDAKLHAGQIHNQFQRRFFQFDAVRCSHFPSHPHQIGPSRDRRTDIGGSRPLVFATTLIEKVSFDASNRRIKVSLSCSHHRPTRPF